MSADLVRRVKRLEGALPKELRPTCILVMPRPAPGRRWVTTAVTLPDGSVMTRDEGESNADFRSRVGDAARAMTGGRCAILSGRTGYEVSAEDVEPKVEGELCRD